MREHGVGHRDVDVASVARALRAEQRAEDGDRRRRRAAEQVGDLQVRQRRRAAALARVIQHAGVAEVIDVVPGRQRARTGLSVAGERAVHDARIDRAHGVVIDAKRRDDSGTEAFDDDVGVARERHERARARRPS